MKNHNSSQKFSVVGLFFYLNFTPKVKFFIVFFTCDVENIKIIGVKSMELKDEIRKLRDKGLGYKKIAVCLNVSANTVKSICKREGLEKLDIEDFDTCKVCGEKLTHLKGKKQKKYCSDACRMKWWKNNQDKMNRQAFSTHQCKCCKREFTSYSNNKRKYCSHECYIKHRFGGSYEH